MLKRLTRRVLKRFGYELCKLSPDEVDASQRLVGSPNDFNYKELQAIRAIAAPGHISLNEARFLGDLVRRTPETSPIIEIGTLFGFSTRFLALYKRPEQSLISVDVFLWNPLGISPTAHEAATRAALRDLTDSANVQLLRADKAKFYENYSGPPPGLVFCDADHGFEATLADLRWAKEVGASIICGHDYDPSAHPGVVQAVEELGGPRELVETLFLLG
jgi:hypothetical protein